MQKFSIKEMERLSGIKAHTLRIWEQRYGLVQPARSDGNHRFYSNEDVKKLLRIAYLYQSGYKISDIAKLEPDEMKDLLPVEPVEGPFKSAAILQLTESVVDFDELLFSDIMDRLIRVLGFEQVMLDVVLPFLNRLGLLWVKDKVLPGQEHFASHLIARKLCVAIDRLSESALQKKGRVLLFTPEGEYHELGLLFTHYLLKRNGFRVTYLGVAVVPDVLQNFYQRHQPTHLLVQLTGNLQDAEPTEYLNMLQQKYSNATVVVNGPVTAFVDKKQLDNRVQLLASTKQVLDFCTNIFDFEVI